MPTQPFLTIVPLNGQKQLSRGATWQFAVILFPPLSIAVQLVQRKAANAWSGVISNAALKMTAEKPMSKSIFFFTSIRSFCQSLDKREKALRTGYGRRKQLFWMIFPLNGQKQLSTGATWQVEVTAFPLLSSAVQLVQCEVTLALAELISKARLKITAQKLISKSAFFFT